MPQVTLSYANLTAGRATATYEQSFTQSDGKLVIAGEPYAQVVFTAGVATFSNLPSSRSIGVGCRFKIEKGTSPNFTAVTEFVSTIPEGNTAVSGSDLLNAFTGSRDNLDLTLGGVAGLLTAEPWISTLAQRIPGFVFKDYAAATIFSQNEFTARGASLYRYAFATGQAGKDPAVPANVAASAAAATAAAPWVVTLTAPTGPGGTTSNLAYNAAAFNSLATDPASRKNLVEAIATVSAPDLSGYARIDVGNVWAVAQAFSQGATVPDRNAGDNGSAAANTKFVQSAIAAIGGSGLANRISIVEERAAQGVNSALTAGVNVRKLSTIYRNPATDIVSASPQGLIVVKAGVYLVFVWATSNRADGNKLYLYNNGTGSNLSTRSISSFTGSNLGDAASQNGISILCDVLDLSGETTLTVRHDAQTAGSDGGGRAANRPGMSELYTQLILWRLS